MSATFGLGSSKFARIPARCSSSRPKSESPIHAQYAPAGRGLNRPRSSHRTAEAGPDQSALAAQRQRKRPPQVADLPAPAATKWLAVQLAAVPQHSRRDFRRALRIQHTSAQRHNLTFTQRPRCNPEYPTPAVTLSAALMSAHARARDVRDAVHANALVHVRPKFVPMPKHL